MKQLTALILMLLAFWGCDEKQLNNKVLPTETKKVSPGFIHTVFFWYATGADTALVADFNNGLASLAKTDGIQSAYWGPSAGTKREVVDNSYDMAWILHFKSKEEHDVYQNHPNHKLFIEKYQSIWDSVKVYDNIVQGSK